MGDKKSLFDIVKESSTEEKTTSTEVKSEKKSLFDIVSTETVTTEQEQPTEQPKEEIQETVTTKQEETPVKKKDPTEKWGGASLSGLSSEDGQSESSEKLETVFSQRGDKRGSEVTPNTDKEVVTVDDTNLVDSRRDASELSNKEIASYDINNKITKEIYSDIKKNEKKKEFNSFISLDENQKQKILFGDDDFFIDENGKEIPITPENKQIFVDAYFKLKAEDKSNKQLEEQTKKINRARLGLSPGVDYAESFEEFVKLSEQDKNIKKEDFSLYKTNPELVDPSKIQDILKAKEFIRDKTNDIAMQIAGYTDEDKADIKEYNDIRRQIQNNENYDYKRFDELEAKVAQLRESNNKLLDEYGNNIEGGDTSDIDVNKVSAKYDNDYEKLSKALEQKIYEYEAIRDLKGDVDKGDSSTFTRGQSVADRVKEVIRLKYIKEAEITALTQALLLNEDVTKRDEDSNALFKGVSAFFETVGKEFSYYTPKTNRQAKKDLVESAQEAGVKLSEDQLSSVEDSFAEKLGDTFAISTKLGLEIGVTTFLTRSVGTGLSTVKGFSRLKKLYDTNKIARHTMNAIESGIAFGLVPDDRTSVAMGVGENIGSKLAELALSKFKALSPMMILIQKSLGGAAGITIEEYAGDLFDSVFEKGLSKEAMQEVFGASLDEGLEKLALTLTLGIMSGGRQGTLLATKSYFEAKDKNPSAETVKDMKAKLEEQGIDPEKEWSEAEADVRKDNAKERIYPDGKGGTISTKDMTVEEEQAKREELGYEPLSDGEIEQSKEDLKEDEVDSDSVYESTTEEELDTKILSGEITEEEAKVLSKERTTVSPELGESYRTKEGVVTKVKPDAKIEDGTVLRVPLSQLSTETEVEGKKKSKVSGKSFKDSLSGVVHVWKNPKDGTIEVVDGKARVELAKSQNVDNVRVQFVKADSFEQAVIKSNSINTESEIVSVLSDMSIEKNQTAKGMRNLATKLDPLIEKLSKNTYSTLLGVEPVVAKLFLQGLKLGLNQTANFLDAVTGAIEYIKDSDSYKALSPEKQKESINGIRKNFNKVKGTFTMALEPVKPKTKQDLRIIKNDLTRKINYIVTKNLTGLLPSANKIAQLAKKNGLTDLEAVQFASEYKAKFENKLASKERFIRRQGEKKGLEGLELEQYVNDGLNKKPKPKSFRQAFNDIANLILKDKTGQLKINEVINNALLSIKAKGVNFTAKQLEQISNAIKRVDMSRLGSVYDFIETVKKISNNAEFTAISNNIRTMQSKAKGLNRSDIPPNQKRDIAEALNLSPRKVEDVAQLESVVKNILDYLEKKDDIDRGFVDKVKELQEQSDKYDSNRKSALNEAMYKSFLKENELTEQEFSITDYNKMIEASKNSLDEDFEESISNDKELSKKRQQLETLANYSMDEISKTEEDKNWTVVFKRDFAELKRIIGKVDLEDLTNDQLKMIVNVNNEIQMYGELSGAGALIAELSGLVDIKKEDSLIASSLRTYNNRIKEILFKRKRVIGVSSAMSFGRFLDRAFIGKKAQEVGSILLSKYKFGLNIAKNNYFKFNDSFEKAYVNKFGLSKITSKGNLDLGAKAYFLSSPKGISEVEAEALFQEKLDKLSQDIETLKGFVNRIESLQSKNVISKTVSAILPNADLKKAKELIESYEEIFESLKDETHESLTSKYNSGKLFTESQAEAFEIAKKQYEKMSKELESSNKLYGKGEFIAENNYTGISYINLGGMIGKSTDNELDNEFQVRGINEEQSGSKISRVSPTKISPENILNFNFFEVTQRRVQDQLLDIHTLGAKLRLRSMINSKYFRNQFEGNPEVYDIFIKKLSALVSRQSVRTIFSLTKEKDGLDKAYNAINKVKTAKLATPGQFLKQGVILASTGIRFGVGTYSEANKMWIKLSSTKEGRALLSKLIEGSDTSNRSLMGDPRLKEALDSMNKVSLQNTKAGKVYKVATSSVDKVLDVGVGELKFTDLMASQVTFIASMIDIQKKSGKYKANQGIQVLLDNKTEDNTFQADQLHSQINNESDVSMQGELYAGNEVASKWLSLILFSFQSHANNNAWNMSNSLLNMLDPNLSKEERYENAKSLAGGIAQILTFRAVSELVSSVKSTGYNMFNNFIPLNIELPDEDDKKAEEAYMNFFTSEFWTRVLINSSADMVSGKIPSDLTGVSMKEFGNDFNAVIYEHLTGKQASEESEVYEGEMGLGGVSMLLDVGRTTRSLFEPYAEKYYADRYSEMTNAGDKASLMLDMNTKTRYADIPGGEITRKLLVAGYLFSNLKGYGYPQEVTRRMLKQMEKSLEGKEYEKVTPLKR